MGSHSFTYREVRRQQLCHVCMDGEEVLYFSDLMRHETGAGQLLFSTRLPI